MKSRQKLQNYYNFSEVKSQLRPDFNKLVEENKRLRKELIAAVNKQHQEMSRAIHLKNINLDLKREVHDAKQEACLLQESYKNLVNSLHA